MQTMYDKLRDKGLVVLAVNELEDDVKVREHIKQSGHTFPVLMDRDNKVANQFGVFGLPVSVFIDQEGRVQEYIKGGLLTEQKINEIVARIQKQEPVRTAALRYRPMNYTMPILLKSEACYETNARHSYVIISIHMFQHRGYISPSLLRDLCPQCP